MNGNKWRKQTRLYNNLNKYAQRNNIFKEQGLTSQYICKQYIWFTWKYLKIFLCYKRILIRCNVLLAVNQYPDIGDEIIEIEYYHNTSLRCQHSMELPSLWWWWSRTAMHPSQCTVYYLHGPRHPLLCLWSVKRHSRNGLREST